MKRKEKWKFYQLHSQTILHQPFQNTHFFHKSIYIHAPEKDMSLQHQVMVLHQDQPTSQKMNIFSFLNQMNVSVESGKTQVFPKGFLKKGSSTQRKQKPLRQPKSEPIVSKSRSQRYPTFQSLKLTHDSPKHQEMLDDLLRKIKVKPGTTPRRYGTDRKPGND